MAAIPTLRPEWGQLDSYRTHLEAWIRSLAAIEFDEDLLVGL